MATMTSTAFDEFKARLKPTHSQVAAIAARKEATAAYISKAFPSTSNLPFARTKLIGSAARDTIIRPMDDVDLMAVFENKAQIFEQFRSDSQSFLYRVRDSLKTYSRVQVVGARGQAVRFFYKDPPHVDVAPVFKWNTDGYGLPDGKGGWLTTDPDSHEAHFKKRVSELGPGLRPLVRMLKRWNRAHSNYLKSFHLEVMVTAAFTSLGADSRKACELFFGWAKNSLAIVDPAGHSGDLSSYLTFINRQSVLANLESARQRAVSANAHERADNHEEAIRLWGIVFGAEFPSYG